jgi:hypothetical protein
LPIGTKIYRVIGKNQYGHWWLENKPLLKKSWRSESAVSVQWNDGSCCVEATSKEEIAVWRGLTASQAVPYSSSNCYLTGGAYQLCVSPENWSNSFDCSRYSWP